MLAAQQRVTLVSTFPCENPTGVEALYVLPVAFGRFAGSQASRSAAAGTPGGFRRLLGRFRGLVTSTRYRLGTLTLGWYGRKLRRLVNALHPDVVHGLRIPFEGMLAAYTPPHAAFRLGVGQ